MKLYKQHSSDRPAKWLIFSFLLVLTLLASCTSSPQATPTFVFELPTGTPFQPSNETPTATPEPTQTETQSPTLTAVPPSETPAPTPTSTPTPVRFAVIGDYGANSPGERDVAELINSWSVDFIITTGDNNYPDGAWDTIDVNIGKYFHEYIHPYRGEFGEGAEINRFFPTLGNHDWNTDQARPYLEYFELPGNERYYDFIWGPVHFFALDSDSREPDGVTPGSVQGQWLQEKLAASTSPWQVVYFHTPPYSSGLHGSIEWMRWPFREWGADLTMAGHDHTYERIIRDGFPHFINGLGGGAIYYFEEIVEGSQVRYAEDYGAMLVEVDENSMTLQFINRHNQVIDTYTIQDASQP